MPGSRSACIDAYLISFLICTRCRITLDPSKLVSLPVGIPQYAGAPHQEHCTCCRSAGQECAFASLRHVCQPTQCEKCILLHAHATATGQVHTWQCAF
jgi:hypothetical protein